MGEGGGFQICRVSQKIWELRKDFEIVFDFRKFINEKEFKNKSCSFYERLKMWSAFFVSLKLREILLNIWTVLVLFNKIYLRQFCRCKTFDTTRLVVLVINCVNWDTFVIILLYKSCQSIPVFIGTL